jgi:transcriptional regulator with XRE-family HTH domain
MSRVRTRRKTGIEAAYRTAAQMALIDLRKALEMTQQDLAVALGTTVRSVARWETADSPRGRVLKRLEKFAARRGCPDHAAEFRRLQLHEQFLRSNKKLFLTGEGLDLQAAIALVWRCQGDPNVARRWEVTLRSLSAAVSQILKAQYEAKAQLWEVEEMWNLHERLNGYAEDVSERSEERREQAGSQQGSSDQVSSQQAGSKNQGSTRRKKEE